MKAGARARVHCVAVSPSPRVTIWPVTKLFASDQKNSTGPARSPGAGDPARRDPVRQPFVELLIGKQARGQHRGHEGRGDDVDPDAVRTPPGDVLAGQSAEGPFAARHAE